MDETIREEIRVVGLAGSLRLGSYTKMAVQIALSGAAGAGATTAMLDLNDYNLALTDLDRRNTPPNVLQLRRDVSAADGIILGTPEYHGGYSGTLKHALDLMGFDEFEGKMIGLVGVSGGILGAANALNGLRTIGRSLHAWVVPKQVSVPRAWDQFSEDGTLNNPRLDSALREVGIQVARFAFLHKFSETENFLDIWQNAPENPGG
jgi:FMN reductase